MEYKIYESKEIISSIDLGIANGGWEHKDGVGVKNALFSKYHIMFQFLQRNC